MEKNLIGEFLINRIKWLKSILRTIKFLKLSRTQLPPDGAYEREKKMRKSKNKIEKSVVMP